MAEDKKPEPNKNTEQSAVRAVGSQAVSAADGPFQAVIEDDPFQPRTRQPKTIKDNITWTASEFIAHAKTPKWYASLALAAVLLSALIYLLTRDVITAGVVIVGAVVLGVYAGRQPRQLAYLINTNGVQIGHKWHSFGEFRSFSVVPEGAFASIVFMPLKRFSPLTTIYYAPKDEDNIINLLSEVLPYEERKPDPIDNFMQRIGF